VGRWWWRRERDL